MPRFANVEGPDPIDVYVGIRLKEVRKARGRSQDELGRALSLTFQQVQKYERGTNRISSSMLVKASRYLGVSVASLLPQDGAESAHSSATLEVIASLRGSEELLEAYSRIRSPRLRRQLVSLARALATDDDLKEAA